MNLALFDFDGTITRSDSWMPFLKFAVPPLKLVVGQGLLLPVLVGYKLGAVPPTRARAAASMVAFRGERAATIRERGAEYASEALPGSLRSEALERVAWHRERGDHIVVVSASLDVYLAPWCRTHGVDLICTELEERAGRLTGRLVGGDCTGAEKARRVKERYELARYESVYAYGDTIEDREMLECAHVKYYRGRAISSVSDI